METSLHKQLKLRYAVTDDQTEVVVDGYRIDAIAECGELIEIQHASLGALRDKTRQLLHQTDWRLRIVKPIVARKRIVTLTHRDGDIKRSRMSPKRCQVLDVFDDLVHFSSVFPMERLTLEVALIEAEEIRVDRAQPTRRGKRYVTIDQRLVDVQERLELRTLDDLLGQLPMGELPEVFDTTQLGAVLSRPRWFARKVAYCLRETKAIQLAGKRGNSLVYSLMGAATSKRRKKRKSAAKGTQPESVVPSIEISATIEVAAQADAQTPAARVKPGRGTANKTKKPTAKKSKTQKPTPKESTAKINTAQKPKRLSVKAKPAATRTAKRAPVADKMATSKTATSKTAANKTAKTKKVASKKVATKKAVRKKTGGRQKAA